MSKASLITGEVEIVCQDRQSTRDYLHMTNWIEVAKTLNDLADELGVPTDYEEHNWLDRRLKRYANAECAIFEHVQSAAVLALIKARIEKDRK